MYLLGYDIGSSTIKAAIVHAATQQLVGLVQYPNQDMDMISRQRGWAEQQPEVWWQHFCTITQRLLEKTDIPPKDIKGIGISYQMHGLVLIDKEQQVLRPSIIWCDSRAVSIGQQAFQKIGQQYCLENLMNSPGNFTASKLKWVKDNEPDIYEKIDKVLLPGDFIAMKLTGEAVTTISGLTEGIFWNFNTRQIDTALLDYYDIDQSLLAERVPTFSIQGEVSSRAASRTGLAEGTPVSYRSGDQPNNALSLNVLHPGEIAATSGTSGVVYGIVDRPVYDQKSRINTFAHVNYEQAHNRIGVLLCLNGAGIQYSWIKHQIARSNHTYADMERMASSVPVGADGLCILPYGNGAERMLENREPNAHMFNLQFNRHTRGHIYRAALEGVAFSFVYGINILKELNLNVDIIRVGNDNMFQSKIFSTTLATLLNCEIEVVETTGAIGAAKAAGIAVGLYSNLKEALSNVKPVQVYDPVYNTGLCNQAYSYWLSWLEKSLTKTNRSEKATVAVSKLNERLKKDVKKKDRELAASQLQVATLNNLIAEIKKELIQLSSEPNETSRQQALLALIQILDKEQDEASAWATFEKNFDLLHDDFFKKVRNAYPKISIGELKMCAYLKMGMSNKEMAQRLNLSIRGIETRRYRLSKKIAASGETTLNNLLF